MEQEIKIIEEKFPLYTNGNRSKRKVRHDFFSNICTNLQAYLLGFIAADGSVNEKRHSLAIQISKKDEKLFDLFRIISPNAHILQRKFGNYKNPHSNKTIVDHGTIRLTIHSKTLYEDLAKLGITQNKTYKEMHIPEQLDKKYIHSFILGYLDGDGYITNSIKLSKISGQISCRAGICSKTNSLLREFQDFLENNHIKSSIYLDTRDKIYYLDVYAKDSLQNLYNLLYSSSNLGLDRKKTKLYRFLYDNENFKQELIKRKLSNL